MYGVSHRNSSTAQPSYWHQHAGTAECRSRRGSDATSRSSVHSSAEKASPRSQACVQHAHSMPSSTTHEFSQRHGGAPAPLLLARSIRDSALHRDDSIVSREANAFGAAYDADHYDIHQKDVKGRKKEPTMETFESTCLEASAPSSPPPLSCSTQQNFSLTASVSGCPSTSTPARQAAPDLPTSFETLWNRIDHYLFEVYTTLQSSDESSLRPLRAPKHRMGWYAVIYNACSGDPAKSRELYARLALFLLHILESHVLFPILQNVDHSGVTIIFGTEDDEAAAPQSSPQTAEAGSSSTTNAWRRLKRFASSANETAGTSSARVTPSETLKCTSSLQDRGSRAGHADVSFAFVRKLFHTATPASVGSTPVNAALKGVQSGEDRVPRASLVSDLSTSYQGASGSRGDHGFVRQPSCMRCAPPSTSDVIRQSKGVVVAGSHATGQLDSRRSMERCGSSATAAASNPLATTMDGNTWACVDLNSKAVERLLQSGEVTQLPRRQSPSPLVSDPLVPALHLRTSCSPSEADESGTRQGRSSPIEPLSFPVQSVPRASVSTEKIRPRMAASQCTASRTVSLAPVAPQTGRVLVKDEEEVLCEANTVSAPLGSALPELCSARNTADAERYEGGLASFNRTDTAIKSPDHPHDGTDDVDASFHTLHSSPLSQSISEADQGSEGVSGSKDGGDRGSELEDAPATQLCSSVLPPSTCDAVQRHRFPSFPEKSSRSCDGSSASTDALKPAYHVSSPLSPPETAHTTAVRHVRQDGRPCSPSSAPAALVLAPQGAPRFTPSAQSTLTGSTSCSSGIRKSTAMQGEEGAQATRQGPPTTEVSLGQATAEDDTSPSRGITEAVRTDARRFSLCYTFIQEWRTFVVFRIVVLSCFRYLDQYYTRRFGMDTITLMCFKLFYVVVYEPLLPLLTMEVQYLMQYVRDEFENTGRVAKGQLALIQETYGIMTELLILVQSTSSSMVAQQVKPVAVAGPPGNGGVAATSGAVPVPSRTGEPRPSHAVSYPASIAGEPVGARSRSNSTPRTGASGARYESPVSSTGTTPPPGDIRISLTSAVGQPAAAGASHADRDHRSGDHPPHTSRARRLLSFLTSGRAGDEAKGSGHSSLTAAPEHAAKATLSSPVPKRYSMLDSNGGETDANAESVRHSCGCDTQSSPREGSAVATDGAALIAPSAVVDLRGTVELRDRLEGLTTGNHLTTQALKQWEGMAADRRSRIGTIVKATATPLATIVMEDIGHAYIAGIRAFYRPTRDAHRSTEAGRSSYVRWVSEVRELEAEAWRHVRLPFLHAAIRCALNEVLVVEPHRHILLDRQYGLRAALDAWTASLSAPDLALAPQLATMRDAAHVNAERGGSQRGGAASVSSGGAASTENGYAAIREGLGDCSRPCSVTTAATSPIFIDTAVSFPRTDSLASAVEALERLCKLFDDDAGDECFVLLAALLVIKFIHDAASPLERHLQFMSDASISPSGANPGTSGVTCMERLVDLIDSYADLVEKVFHNHVIVRQAFEDAVEELMRPARWTQTGALRASQQCAHDARMAAVGGSFPNERAVSMGHGLPSVLLSRDARHATLPLVELATAYPQAAQQLKPSVLLARYADHFLRQEQGGGGRVLSIKVHKRIRLLSRLVLALEDKDTFLEHHRLHLARRLLGFAGGAPAVGGGGASGKQAHPDNRVAAVTTAPGTPDLEAERQLGSCLQAHLGVAATRAFEVMIRDYESSERIGKRFEQERNYATLKAKIRVKLITSAHWPTYGMPALQPHISLHDGIEAFRSFYARQHPSRRLLWVSSLGTATLTAELASGTKQIVASTLLATLLLTVSDAYNAESSAAAPPALTGEQLSRKLGLPFHTLRTHLFLLTHHHLFNLLCWLPADRSTHGGAGGAAAPAALHEHDAFTLNPSYTHKLHRIRLPVPKTRLLRLPEADGVEGQQWGGGGDSAPLSEQVADDVFRGTDGLKRTSMAFEEGVVAQRVLATRRILIDAALVRLLKSRRVADFDEILQAVVAQLARQFTPTRRDVKQQLEGLIDREYVQRSGEHQNAFLYIS